jgi:hypothetical protein
MGGFSVGVRAFIQDQVLGMKWLNGLLGSLLSALGLDVSGRWGGSVQFFLYDVAKITFLLCLLIFIISYIQSYFPPERSKKLLGRFRGLGANCIAALLGTVTPFCSCSSIPLFIGFTSAGLPVGVTFSFLISSPMVDLGSLVLLMSIFGARVAVVYVILASLWRSSAAPSSKSCTWSGMWRTSSKTPPAWTLMPRISPGVTGRPTPATRWRAPLKRCSPTFWWAWGSAR